MNILKIKNRKELYKYIKDNYKSKKDFYIFVKKGNPKTAKNIISYIDAVECALCFGYIDSITKSINGKLLQRFSPRKSKSNFTELNKERIRRLIKLKEMSEAGLKACPDINKEYIAPNRIINALKKDKEAYKFFKSTPRLYQDIRISYIDKFYSKNKLAYKIALSALIYKSHNHKLYGEWNDYGRLLNY